MKRKILGILIMMLLILTAIIPLVSSIQLNKDGNKNLSQSATGWPPSGWSEVVYGGNGHWEERTIDGSNRDPYGASGSHAIADSDLHSALTFNVGLQSPSFDLSDATGTVTIECGIAFEKYIDDIACIKVFSDNGLEEELICFEENYKSIFSDTLNYNSYSSKTGIKIEFYYYTEEWSWFFSVDNVVVGDSTTTYVDEDFEQGGEIPGLYFYQVDYYYGDGSEALDTYIGQIKVDILALTNHFGIGTGYLNIVSPLGWVVQNLLVTTQAYSENLPYVTTKFQIREGAFTTININSYDGYVDFSMNPTPTSPWGPFGSYPVSSISHYLEGEWHIVPIPEEIFFPCSPTNMCLQDNHPNVQTANNQCGPAAVANSLQYLENEFPDEIEIPNENDPGLSGDDTLVGKIDSLSGRPVRSRTDGDYTSCWDLQRAKLDYINENNLGNDIKVKHQSPLVDYDMTVGDVTSINQGEGGKNITIQWIYNELCAGEDVEVLYNWQTPSGWAGHFVELTGVGHTCGIPFIKHISDQVQTDRDPNDGEGCDSIQSDHVLENDDGFLEVIGGDMPTGACIVWACSQSPNDPPETPEAPEGETEVSPGEEHEYQTDPVEDPDGDRVVRYEWDFNGDGIVDEVTEEPIVSHSWPEQGRYDIRVRARDEFGGVSDWSDPLPVEVPRNRATQTPLLNFLQQHPMLFQLFQRFLQL